MSLILYAPEEAEFKSNGIGILKDVVDDEVYEELNGQYELTFKYPVCGIHFSSIATECYVTAKPNPVADPQAFRIYRGTKPMGGLVTVYARHMAYRNKKIAVLPFTAENVTDAFTTMKSSAVNECPFSFWTDKDTTAKMTVSVPKDIWTLLGGSEGSILDCYGGEYEFDMYTVRLWKRRGADRGVNIRYGKNLKSLKQDENIANVCTGIVPYWTDGNGALVLLDEKYISGPGTYREEKLKTVDFSQDFETQPTQEQLRERTEKYIADNDIGKPNISLTVEFVQLEQTEEYKDMKLLEQVLLGDTVNVWFPEMQVDVSARAVAARYRPSLGRYKSISLGRVRANLASTIVEQQKEIEKAKNPSNLEQAVNRATDWITNGRGYMVVVKDADGNWIEQCSLDTMDINSAVNVWRWNNGGFGHSKTGYSGPYRTALTQDGEIVADFITTGTLDAALAKVVNLVAESIVAGKLSSKDKTTFFDLDNAVIENSGSWMWDETKSIVLRMTSGGLIGVVRTGDTEQHIFHLHVGEYGICIDDGKDLSNPVGWPILIESSSGLTLGNGAADTTINGRTLQLVSNDMRFNGMTCSWKSNGDGTYTMIGTPVTT